MGVRCRLAQLAVAAVTTASVVGVPTPETSVAPPPVTARVDLAAAIQPIAPTKPDPVELAAARDALERLDPDAAALAVFDAPAALSATGDWISSTYQFVMYWASYGVDLANYVLQFIPFGYLISGQINIVYDTLVVPISDSFIYDLTIPVVNDPLNLGVWINGIGDVAYTSVVSLINAGIAEFNYFFGWLIPPLPPLPFAAAAVPEEMSLLSVAAEELPTTEETLEQPATEETLEPTEPTEFQEITATVDEIPTVVEPLEPAVVVEPAVSETLEPAVVESLEPEVVAEPAPKDPEPTTPTTDSKNGVSAQGEVRTGGQTAAPSVTTPESPSDDDAKPVETTDTPAEPAAQTDDPDDAPSSAEGGESGSTDGE